jgi:hypothetical protein
MSRIRKLWSGRPDLNRRPLDPQSDRQNDQTGKSFNGLQVSGAPRQPTKMASFWGVVGQPDCYFATQPVFPEPDSLT